MDMLTKREPNKFVLLTPHEMTEADRLAVAQGTSGFDLMEAAGLAVTTAVRLRWPVCPLVVLCGPGNNGGDGFAAARHLAAAGWPVRISLLGSFDDLTGDAARHAAAWKDEIEPFSPEILDGAGVVVDAIFGAGLSRPIEGLAAIMIDSMKARGSATCAIDVPSGVDGATGEVRGTAAAADMTVTFFRKKPGHLLFPGRALCGSLVVADIGIPETVLAAISPRSFENNPDLWLDRYPWPEAESYKFKRGEVLALGGDTITGASRLSAHSAMRVGAGLVTLAVPARVWPIYAEALGGIIVQSFEGIDDFNTLLTDKRRNAIAIGPGAGVGSSTRQYVLAALATQRAVVIDADALTSFSEEPDVLFRAIIGPCVLTPHEGEFARLFKFEGDKLQRARNAAKQSHAIVLLKGSDTVIAAPDGRAIINSNAPPQLATGGSGDVLTGFIAGLMAQGLEAFDAAAAAVWLHGECASTFGLGLVAADLPDILPQVLQRLNKLA